MTEFILSMMGVAVGGAGYLIGYAHSNRKTVNRHQHAWGQWEDCELKDGYHNDRAILTPGQKRECFGCGQRDVRKIIAP